MDLMLKIIAYNYTDGILFVEYPNGFRYKYFNISQYHYKKIRYFLIRQWSGRAIAYIKNFKYERIRHGEN